MRRQPEREDLGEAEMENVANLLMAGGERSLHELREDRLPQPALAQRGQHHGPHQGAVGGGEQVVAFRAVEQLGQHRSRRARPLQHPQRRPARGQSRRRRVGRSGFARPHPHGPRRMEEEDDRRVAPAPISAASASRRAMRSSVEGWVRKSEAI